MPDGVRLLKLGIIYGYNASGKSNLISAFDFLKGFWFKVLDNKEEEFDILPFLLDTKSRIQPIYFKLIFYVNGIKHRYELSIKENIILSEKLEYYPGTQPAIVFTRTDQDGISKISFGAKINITKTIKEAISVRCLPNMSFFAAYNQINTKIEEIIRVINWMRNQIMPKIEPITKLQYYTEQLINKETSYKELITKYLQNADFNISSIKSTEIIKEISDDFIKQVKELGIPEAEIKRMEKERTIKTLDTDFEHSVINNGITEHYNLPMDMQSDGTRRVFGLTGPILEAVKNDAFLFVDEIEAKLHPSLVEYLIENFLRQSKQSQLIVTTHYDNLFDEEELLRKDNFYFTEKEANGATEIYRLTDFNGLNRISSLQKAYRFGKFGAVPNIG